MYNFFFLSISLSETLIGLFCIFVLFEFIFSAQISIFILFLFAWFVYSECISVNTYCMYCIVYWALFWWRFLKIMYKIQINMDIIDKIGSAIKCFECNSHYNQGCELDNVPSNFSVDCSLKQDRDDRNKPIQYTICRKVMQIIEFSVNQCKLLVLLLKLSILPNQIHIRLSTLFRSSAS